MVGAVSGLGPPRWREAMPPTARTACLLVLLGRRAECPQPVRAVAAVCSSILLTSAVDDGHPPSSLLCTLRRATWRSLTARNGHDSQCANGGSPAYLRRYVLGGALEGPHSEDSRSASSSLRRTGTRWPRLQVLCVLACRKGGAAEERAELAVSFDHRPETAP